jgi:hypothetical protein
MQSHAQTVERPELDRQDDAGPHLVAWRYDRGGLAIMVEDLDQYCDGQVLWSFSPEVGVRIGEPTVLALSGEPSMLLFSDSFEAHRKFFSEGMGEARRGQ